MRTRLLWLIVVGCGGPPTPVIENRGAAEAPGPPRACWLSACDLVADLDGDARPDQVELVRAGDLEGLRVSLATGAVLLAGAGHPVDAMPGGDPDHEPLALEADLDFVVSARVRAGQPPCPAEAIELSGGDAAAQLCVIGGAPRAFHLGF